MIATTPEIQHEEVRSIIEDLARQGYTIPLPKEVKVVASEDHDGDPAIFLTVIFSKKEDPAELPLKRVSPLIKELRDRILASNGYERPVISRIVRLGDPVAR